MKKTIFFTLLFLSSIGLSYAQTKVTGKVTAADDGNPVPFATVVAKGTSVSTTTNAQGVYSINVPANAKVLVFSFFGMESQEVEIGARSIVDAILINAVTQLDETVVVGYGVAVKGGNPFSSRAVVTKEQLELPVSSFDKALQGNATGVLSLSNSGQPGAGQQVVIRGVGSIRAGIEPLYIVDGVPVAIGNFGNMTQTDPSSVSGDNLNALAGINPSDIESVTVFKDAAATSIYGSRASNGVIFITTKRGKTGKTMFNFKATTGFSSRTNKDFRVMNKDQYLDYATDMLTNAGYPTATVDVNGKPVLKYIADNFRVRDANKDFYDFNWMDQAYVDNAPIMTADLSATGGSDKTRFFTSFSYYDQKGIVIDTYLKRYTGRLNLDHQVSENFKFSFNTMLSYSDQSSAMTTGGYYINPVFGATMYAPLDAGIIAPGSFLYSPSLGTFSSLDPGVNIDYLTTYANANFIANSMFNEFYSRTSRNISDITAQWNILDGLVLKSVIGIDYFYLSEFNWLDPRPRGNSASYGKGYSETSNTENFIWNQATTLNYMKSFGFNSINILLGNETQADANRVNGGIALDFPGTSFHYADQGATYYSVYGNRESSSLASFFSSVNYNYMQRYFLSASLRTDGSSRLSVGNKWSTFWSLGASWKFSEEGFAKNISWLTSASLRASYGTSGNSSGISAYAAMGLYGGGTTSRGNHNYAGLSGIFPYQIANPDLRWERNAMADLGLDFSILEGRLGATIEVYRKTTTDLLLDRPLSRTSGFTSILSNIGEMYNQGIEVAINAAPLRKKNFSWNVDFNISSNKNRIVKLDNGADIIDPFNAAFIYREGESAQSFYRYRWAGVNPADGRAMYYDRDGNIMFEYNKMLDTREIVGSGVPDFFGGITNRFAFYGIDLSFMFYFTYGNKIYDASWMNMTGLGANSWRNQHVSVVTDRWRKEGDIASFPKAYFQYPSASYGAATDKSMFDGSYVRLRDITVGYTLPKKWTDVAKLSNVRVFMQATNLLTLFSDYPGADPEVGGGKYAGYYYLGYPNAKTVLFGLNVQF